MALKQAKNRIEELDVFRGIAAMAVVLFHYTKRFRDLYGHNYPEFFDFKYGFLGVQLFFIISGFVIYMSINNSSSTFQFIKRRFIRLYPAYWICITLTFIIVNFIGLPGRGANGIEFFVGLTMFQEVLNIKHVDGVYWSLTIELFFYILMILISFAGILQKKYVWTTIWLTLIWTNYYFPFPFKSFYLNLENGMLFIGGIYFFHLYNDKKNMIHHLFVLFSLFSFIHFNHSLSIKIIVSFYYLLFYLFIFNKLNWIVIKPLLFLGQISYPLYLIHNNIGFAMLLKLKKWGVNELFSIITVVLCVILLAWVIMKYIEKPIIRYLKTKIIR